MMLTDGAVYIVVIITSQGIAVLFYLFYTRTAKLNNYPSSSPTPNITKKKLKLDEDSTHPNCLQLMVLVITMNLIWTALKTKAIDYSHYKAAELSALLVER